jgi:hypothetical protein
MSQTEWFKDPDDTAWYEFDWSLFLDAGETITSCVVTVDANLTEVFTRSTATSVLVEVTGGTAWTPSVVTCEVNTSALNTFQAAKVIKVVPRQT